MMSPAQSPQATTMRVLVVDDETSSRAPVAEFWRDEGHEVRVAADGFKALGRVDEDWSPDLLITDLKMPGMDGVELLKKLRERLPDLAVIVMTAFATVESAVQAMQEGADDYLIKPVHFGQLEVSVKKVMGHRDLVRDHRRISELLANAKEPVRGAAEASELVGESRVFRELMSLARQVAQSDAPIMVAGAVGTGKRALARAIHRWSPRAEGPFVELNLGLVGEAAMDEALTESLGEAAGGSLALIGIDKLSKPARARLSQYFEDTPQDAARIISTTSEDLRELVSEGVIEQELAYRLGVVNLHVPALKERCEDIPVLAAHLVRRHAATYGRPGLSLAERALGVIEGFDWPGNVRQLDQVMQRAVVAARGRSIEARDLPPELRSSDEDPQRRAPAIPGSTLEDIERYAIMATLEATGGSTSRAAKILGISVRKVQYRLREARAE